MAASPHYSAETGHGGRPRSAKPQRTSRCQGLPISLSSSGDRKTKPGPSHRSRGQKSRAAPQRSIFRYFLEGLFSSLTIFFILFIYLLFMAVLGLHFCARAFSSCGKWGPLFIAVRGPLITAASPVAEHRLQTRRLSNCGSRA